MPETRHFCPHCEERVSLSTLHRHKQLYYDEERDKWTKSTACASSDDSCHEEELACLDNSLPETSEGNYLGPTK